MTLSAMACAYCWGVHPDLALICVSFLLWYRHALVYLSQNGHSGFPPPSIWVVPQLCCSGWVLVMPPHVSQITRLHFGHVKLMFTGFPHLSQYVSPFFSMSSSFVVERLPRSVALDVIDTSISRTATISSLWRLSRQESCLLMAVELDAGMAHVLWRSRA